MADPSPALAPFFEAQLRALVNAAKPVCPPEAKARLLGAAFEGGSAFSTDAESLHSLLEKRFLALHGEIRAVRGEFELVQADNCPGLAIPRSGEVWLGRALVLNAAVGPLVQRMQQWEMEVPRFLARGARSQRRLCLLMRVHRDVIPEGMARRVIRVTHPMEALDGTNVISVAWFPAAEGDEFALIASAVLPEGTQSVQAAEQQIAAAVRDLMPFADERLRRAPAAPRPEWDDVNVLEDPPNGGGWPAQSEPRLCTRPPVYRLARGELGVLGMEGDVLLGWHAGDAIREEFS